MLAQLPFPLDSQQGYFLPCHISARSRRISPTFEHQTEPETLGTSQLLRICLTSRAEAALAGPLPPPAVFYQRQVCSAQTSHIKTFSWLLQPHFNLKKGQETKHRSLLPVQTQTVQCKPSASEFGGQDPPSHTLHPEAVSTIRLPGPSHDSLSFELHRHAGTRLSGSSPSCLREISGGDQT